MGWSLGDLAEAIDGEVVGDSSMTIEAVASLEDAGASDLSLYGDPRYKAQAEETSAGALIVGHQLGSPEGFAGSTIVVEQPSLALAKLLRWLSPDSPVRPGIHSTAVIDASAEVDESAEVGPYVVIGAGSTVGAGSRLRAHVTIGAGCTIGAACDLRPHVVLYDGTELGERTIVHSGTVIGADGFGYAFDAGEHRKVPQVGRVVIGDDCEVGANSCIDRATLGETSIGEGSKIDNLVQVGHNVKTGRGVILCGQVAIAGSTKLGDYVVMGGRAGAVDHVEIGDRTQVAATSLVTRSVAADQKLSSTVPAIDLGRWRRQALLLGKLDQMNKRLRALERQLAASESTDS